MGLQLNMVQVLGLELQCLSFVLLNCLLTNTCIFHSLETENTIPKLKYEK